MYRMMMTINVLICLIILTSQCVHSKVINVNSDDGNDSTECYVHGRCACSSLYTALWNITSNTIINITSKSVALHNTTTIGSGKLTNITITGSNVTIMCNNSGSVYCESCDNVSIEGITWDRCGDPNGLNLAGVTFNGTTNISLVNCTFQHSQIRAVTILDASSSINISQCNFLSNKGTSNCGGLSISSGSVFVDLVISNSYFYDNGFYSDAYSGQIINVVGDSGSTTWNVTITNTIFFTNMGAVNFQIDGNSSFQLNKLTFNNNNKVGTGSVTGIQFSLRGNSNLFVSDSSFANNVGSALLYLLNGDKTVEVLISNTNFTNTSSQLQLGDYSSSADPTVQLLLGVDTVASITLVDVEISHSISTGHEYGDSASLYIGFLYNYKNHDVQINMTRVRLMSNTYLGDIGGAVYIQYGYSISENHLIFEECEFFNNTAHRGAALYIENYSYNGDNIVILNSKIHHNTADDSIVYINSKSEKAYMAVTVNGSNFTNNTATCIHLVQSQLVCEDVVFANNIADNGAAVYIDEGSTVTMDGRGTVQFINNSAIEYGGAIYINLVYTCPIIPISYNNSEVVFINNTAEISGNSLYFTVPAPCDVVRNTSNPDSILYIPCQFNYFQPVNGKMMDIPCDLNYTLLNGTGAPIVTSPHELRLYFPYNEGCSISSASKPNTYYIRDNILGHQVKFTGAVFDYFGKLAEPTQFNVKCIDCVSTILLSKVHFVIDNITSLGITFSGSSIESKLNVTVELTSAAQSIKQINAALVVELSPCIDLPGYRYSAEMKTCICYQHNVDCHHDYNEIKKGYWFGNVKNTATTAPCFHYCMFNGYKETRQGYFKLPDTIDAQCNHHRIGRACGECSSGYTLSYDSTDCINVADQCGPGWTISVIVLTCLYWVVIVAGVFGLMYFKPQISLGYLYGLIYYYSIIRILLDNNPYYSDAVFQFASVLSSFAQLTPQFLGKLCFVRGLSGIDQLFIHYSHAVAVTLLLLLIVLAAKLSTRITLFVSCCIIRVICLLILLSYTSIASTSLQLLQPLRFTDIKEWYTYSSPSIQYFHGRHAAYGVVAALCELVIVIGLPLLLLLEPFLNKKINLIRIKPLLDQFQGCYKDKYRWFAAYYLICRQVIFLIAYNFNNNYYNTVFYLQTACVVIAMIHALIQPYQSNSLNALDGAMLLLMIQANAFIAVDDSTFIINGMIVILLPILLFSTFIIRKALISCSKKKKRYRYDRINNADVTRLADSTI